MSDLVVLCLDGGGVRGLSSLLILRTLIQQMKTTYGLRREPLPCEVFDLICGTSTGGIIALLLGRLRMSVDDAIIAYVEMSRTVFEFKKREAWYYKAKTFWKRMVRGEVSKDFSALYDAYKLEKWMEDLVAKHEPGSYGFLKDPEDGTSRCCPTFVVGVREWDMGSPARLFRTYRTSEGAADTCMIWEAARATTAASPFFVPVKIGYPGTTYLDGSYSGSNNPSELAWDEVHALFPSRRIGCFISLGTGLLNPTSAYSGPHRIAEACIKLYENCEGVHNKVCKIMEANRVPYFRFSVIRSLGNIQFDEWKHKDDIVVTTRGYMANNEQKLWARQCIETLEAKAYELEEHWALT